MSARGANAGQRFPAAALLLLLAAALLVGPGTPSSAGAKPPTRGQPPPDVQAAIERARPAIDRAALALRAKDRQQAGLAVGAAIEQVHSELGPGHAWSIRIVDHVRELIEQRASSGEPIAPPPELEATPSRRADTEPPVVRAAIPSPTSRRSSAPAPARTTRIP